MEKVEGYVERILFRNAENGYTVIKLNTEEQDEITCVGTFSYISEGEYLEIEGDVVYHPVYAEQIKVSTYRIKEPEDVVAMERYLASGAVKGIGPSLAKDIVKKFKGDTFRVMEEEPELLQKVRGIGPKKVREIAVSFEEKREMRSAMLFLQQYNISSRFAVKIYSKYGNSMYDIIRTNPYRLAEDIDGIGFRLADDIAMRVGIAENDEFRIKSGILYELTGNSGYGNVYIPKEQLLVKARDILNVPEETIEKYIADLAVDRKLIIKEVDGAQVVYDATLYYMEMNCARMLTDLSGKYTVNRERMAKRLKEISEKEQITLDEKQEKAVIEAAENGVFVLTGGPGTGKTTTINTIIRFFESESMDILLAAPTGRAAKRMSETTGMEAQTIHRLLELKVTDAEGAGMRFERDESNPLETDVVIIDEMSMVDIYIFHALLKALLPGTRLILVGDMNQLPSVGPGNVLKDIISSQVFSVVSLSKIFRQAAQSDIVVNAHKILAGQEIKMDNKSRDFFVLSRSDSNMIISNVIQLIKEKLPGYVDASWNEIQVLTPMRSGELGVERLNKILQQYLNPKAPDKSEYENSRGIFREGDKVMQIKNNYQITWVRKSASGITFDEGVGVFNGDMGIVKEINTFAETITVVFDEDKEVEYRFSETDELEHAYAITIHKSQGSEYPAVIMPILTGPAMLLNRNLLYTAVTRAKRCVTIVGSTETVYRMICNANEQKRYSGLRERIVEINNVQKEII
ncbi:MAG: ATP-dependent RecD-like DNA helicase [Lachnospiraceae bacterium]|nr:ATP-dependent RecD-like DNA helicase [Lachnospiraceae bacterium]